jgi:hypothetical protein
MTNSRQKELQLIKENAQLKNEILRLQQLLRIGKKLIECNQLLDSATEGNDAK